MKRILMLFIAVGLTVLTAFSQNGIVVSGYVYTIDVNSITPVEDQEVNIAVDSVNTGFTYQNTVLTDENGYFEDIVVLPPGYYQGVVHVSTFDSCLGTYQEQIQFLMPGVTLTEFFFYLCSPPPGCQAMFSWINSPANTLTVEFSDMSIGDYTTVLWDFGDNAISTEPNPVHTYAQPGMYIVCLTISDSANNCWNQFCDFVSPGQTGNGCENYFLYYSNPASNTTFTFEGYMMDPTIVADAYFWDFGDGTTGEGQTVTHYFQPNGVAYYLVSLTTVVSSPDSVSCTAISTQEVWIYGNANCKALYSYYPDSLDLLTINFQDLSYVFNGTLPTSWTWDFGDGNTSTLQNPVHTYADTGFYSVCLTISDSSGQCFDTFCDMVPAGIIIPPPLPCENYFWYYQEDSMTYTFSGEAYMNGVIVTDQAQFSWDFGDGTFATGQTVTHTFQQLNTDIYTVCLTAIISNPATNDSCYSLSCQDVFLNGGGGWDCWNWFDFTNDTSLTVTFNGYAASQYNVLYFWEFGDGVTATGQNVTHTYAESGMYNVTLTTINTDSCSWTSVMSIWVGGYTANIFGTIFLTNGAVADAATVRLMVMDTLNMGVVEILSTSIDSMGSYVFQNIAFNNYMVYYIQAELTQNSSWYGQYMPTYHQSSLSWEGAWPILPIFSWQADVYMIESYTLTPGPGSIGGTLGGSGLRDGMGGIQVVLMDQNGNPLTYVYTDENGQFLFTNLAYGTYLIHVEMLMVHSQQMLVTISADNPNPVISVLVMGAEAYLDIDENPTTMNTGEIYPNPVTSQGRIEITSEKPGSVVMEIYSFSGQRIYLQNVSVNNGTTTVDFSTNELQSGLYLLRFTTQNGEIISKKFVKN